MSDGETRNRFGLGGGVPNPDTAGPTYRWEPRYFAPLDRDVFYVLRKGRNRAEKVVAKYRDPENARRITDALNNESPWEVM